MIAKKYLSENYDCNGYLSKYEDGYYSRESYLQLVLPVSEASINSVHQHLIIGHAGADGVEFCFRFQKTGIWAFYPIENRFEKIANNIEQLIEGWCNNTIKV
ncbi:hypothetical protein LRP50_21890 [Enterovibrio sp. ZSDZ42]|uniref:Uncharacterized protein n=1 Tax=Enterovibrio gelatinilyticus TaxID=2899819 RepID=A0ABT5R7N5_9GAMM|nr:hypothetical protein [Enterovibrio sp. ZSDZ42]MDD1795776.1 hypothetical protein [Enterovibrio sp. ZSDZ42]